jgi:histidine triad (HIT) family protein
MPGHTLVVPKRHVETILDLTVEDEARLAHTTAHAARVLTRELQPDGILVVQRNGLAAEQTVNHVHVHVVPRRAGFAWPPTEWIEVTPLEERQELAAQLSAAW